MIDRFENKIVELNFCIKQLMEYADSLKEANADLKRQVRDAETKYEHLQHELKQLQRTNDDLKIARTITAKTEDFDIAEKKVVDLVREIDKCISFLKQ